MTQAPTPGPLSGDDELIERGLRSIRTYDAVRSLRDALTATTARLTGYDWNADPDAVTKQQGDAFSAADRVFSDLDAAVAAHPDIDLPECDACNGTGKIEEPARTEGANQHSACVRSCDECDGSGFAPDESLAPTAPVEASGSEREDDDPTEPEMQRAEVVSALLRYSFEGGAACDVADEIIGLLRPQPSGETRDAVAKALGERRGHPDPWPADYDDADAALSALSAHPLALGGQHSGGEGEAAWLEAEAQLSEISAAIGSVRFMDPPDGGSVTLAEQVRRMRLALEEAEASLSTTPARAKAQGEGAAGEASAYRVRMISDDPAEWVLMHPEKALDFLSRKGWESQPLYAHPSPTPAADADKVRIAVEALGLTREMLAAGSDRSLILGHIDQALAALKSTAAKEGGA